jgi:hypothetical protein
MYQPTGEDVKSDEERSIESEDLQKDEISDLFDHSAEDLEEASLGNPSDLTTAPTLGVPILNILGRTQAGYQDGKSTDEGKTAARRGGVQRLPGGEQSGRRLSSIVGSHWTPQRDPTRGIFTRQDIESSDGTTQTGSQAFDQVPHGRGYETRVEGYGSPREKEGEKMTQPLPTSKHSEPLDSDNGGFRPKVPLKPSGPPLHPSRPTVQKTEGVEFTWAETSGIEEKSAELQREKDL